MGFKLAGILFAVMLAMGSLGYWYYTDSQAVIGQLRENNATLEVANSANQATLTNLRASSARSEKLGKDLQAKLQISEAYGDELRRTLQKHQLTTLARKKPGLIEARINEASNKLFDDITAYTND